LNEDGDDSSSDGLNEDGDDSTSDGLNDFFESSNSLRIIPTRSCSRSPSPTMRLLAINKINDTIYFNFGEDLVGYGKDFVGFVDEQPFYDI
jgi:hypothetical protein